MKYFIDFEFIEGFHKPLFGKRRHFIDMISVGVVCEDGREYYSISTDFNPKDADEWVRKNVISKLPDRDVDMMDSPRRKSEAMAWKPERQIKSDLLEFFGCKQDQLFYRAPDGIEVYGYYADYDWVLLCSIFGRMIDLPKGFPMYCRDLKQMLDDKLTQPSLLFSKRMKYGIVDTDKHTHTLSEKLEKIKAHPDYPRQFNEHNALDDAKWNYDLYKFLQIL